MKKTVLAFAFILTACGNIPIENQIYASRATLTVAERGALGYVDQPLCGLPEAEGKPICSKPDIIRKIKKADNAAQSALDAAEKAQTEAALQIVQTSINALLEITNEILKGE